MEPSTPDTAAVSQTRALRRDALTTRHLVFCVVSAAAPLTTIVGYAALTLMLAGPAAPVGYLIAGVVFAVFAVGFTAMSRHIRNTGALYAYITQGIGKTVGTGSAVVAYLAYTFVGIGFCAGAGFFASTALKSQAGLTVPWGVCAAVIAVVCGLIAYRGVDVGAKVLGVFLLCELALVAILSVAILVAGPPEGLSLETFNPSTWSASALGALFVVTFGTYLGIEQTAVYSEEVRDARKAVPRATYVAVAVLAVVNTFVSWLILQAIGPNALGAFLSTGDPYTLVYRISDDVVGSLFTNAMTVLVVTSFVAGILAFLNAGARYLFSMGRSEIVPASLGRTAPDSAAPTRAVTVQTLLFLVPVALGALAGLDPFTQLVLWGNTPGLISLLLLQLLTCIAVIRFFRRRPADENAWHRLVAPTIAGILIAGVLYLMISRMGGTTGLALWGNVLLLLPFALAFGGGIWRARYLHARKPQVYARLGEDVSTPAG